MVDIKCTTCKKNKSEASFSIFRNKRNKTCKECRTKNNLWYSEDRNDRRTKAKTYYLKNKSRVAEYRSILRLDRKYSLTKEAYKEMLLRQKDCPICGISFTKVKACVDHSHKTGNVRGLLCRICNLRLQVIEDKNFISKAESYLNSMK